MSICSFLPYHIYPLYSDARNWVYEKTQRQLCILFNIVYLIFFCILTYAIIYILIHHIIFWLYLYFLNILYFFKYSCTNIFHRHSLHTIYYKLINIIQLSGESRLAWITNWVDMGTPVGICEILEIRDGSSLIFNPKHVTANTPPVGTPSSG